jgi:hypothetical protein
MEWEPSRNDPSMDDIFDRFSDSVNRFRRRRPGNHRVDHRRGTRPFQREARREEMMRRDFLRLE